MTFFGLQRTGEPTDRGILLESLVAGALGIGCGLVLFPLEASLIGVFLCAFAQMATTEELLERNRVQIYDQGVRPRRANFLLARSLLVLFLGILASYVVAVQLSPADRLDEWFDRQLGEFIGGSITDVHFGTAGDLAARNGLVLFVCFLFALIYRHGGMLLVLAWNASRWGVIFSYIAVRASDQDDVVVWSYLLRTMIAILPHLILEAVAYILAAMSGVFLSKALEKYDVGSVLFTAVVAAVIRLSVISGLILIVAATVEAELAPRLVALLF
ncbi:MAG: hypothetical protein ACI9WU_001864 [Myxococcota bacterium]|jgi:hypothetical protein